MAIVEHRRIAVAGLGYVGMANAVLLARNNSVVAVDISPERVQQLNAGKSPVKDAEIEQALGSGQLHLQATTSAEPAYADADFVIIATPTNYDPQTRRFDTASVEGVIDQVVRCNKDATIVVRSTIPVGFTADMRRRFRTSAILFCPEFLRENRALTDNLYPSRIILGVPDDPAARARAKQFADLLVDGAIRKDVPVLTMQSDAAEAVKLFSNAYLALRVGFFNELDTFAEAHALDAGALIRGVCLDPRIGDQYNNPSFGYGGKCLPKDTKQLLMEFGDLPCEIVRAAVETNASRKAFVADRILERLSACAKETPTVGIYRMAMKTDSDNIRDNSTLDVLTRLAQKGAKAVLYEPLLDGESYLGWPVVRDLAQFKAESDLVIANRYHPELADVSEKLYTRDLFSRD